MSAESSGGSGGNSGNGNSGDGGDGGGSSNIIRLKPRRETAVKDEEQLLTVKDVVFWTKGSRSKIYEASKTGALKAILLWGNRLRFRRADVQAWLESQMTQLQPREPV